MNKPVAFKIASAMMMGTPINELDKMSKSAIVESAYMILGNAATILYNKGFTNRNHTSIVDDVRQYTNINTKYENPLHTNNPKF